MKFTIRIAAALLLAIAFTTIEGAQDADRKLNKAFKKELNSKTWEVYYSTTDHMSYGDKFSVKESGSKIYFKPFYKLRTKWAHKDDADYMVDLTDGNTYFCGMTELKTKAHTEEPSGHGPWHLFVIEVTDSGDLKITWSHADFEGELSGTDRTAACQQTLATYHGGMAHAEPN